MSAAVRGLAAFLCCLLAPFAARAGAWSQDADHWLFINQFDYYQANVTGYNQQGNPAGHGTYKQIEFSPYIEYGVTPELTIGAQPRFQYVNLRDGASGEGSNTGLVQANLFARYTIYKWDFDVLSFQAQFDIPGADNHPQPQVALTNLESEARVLYGHSFDALPWGWTGFFDGEAAFRYLAGSQANQIRWDMTLGVRPRPDWLVLFQTFFTFGLNDQRGTGADYDLYRLQLSVVKQITDNIALQIGGWHDAGGRNIALGNAIIAAIWLRF